MIKSNQNGIKSFNQTKIIHSDLEIEKIKKNLRGVRLQIYLLLIRNKDSSYGVREIYRELDLSTVSLAQYHLKKLEELELIKKNNDNKYEVINFIPIAEFEHHLNLKGRLIPNEVFYLTFYASSMILAIILFFIKALIPLLFLLFSISVVATFRSIIKIKEIRERRFEKDLSCIN